MTCTLARGHSLKIQTKEDRMRIVYSPVNQAWFVMFGDVVLRIFNEKADAQAYTEDPR